MDIYDQINMTLVSDDMLVTAEHLMTLSEMAANEKNRRMAADTYKRRLRDAQFAYIIPELMAAQKLSDALIENEVDYVMLSGRNAINQYISLCINSDLPPVKFFRSLGELGQGLKRDFMPPTGRYIEESFIKDILGHLNQSYNFTLNVYGDYSPIFVMIDNAHKEWNSVSAMVGIRQFVILFHFKDGVKFSPEFVFLHELGHIVQNRFGSATEVPASFQQFIKKSSQSELNNFEICELFADCFAMAVLCDTPYEQYDKVI